MDFKDWLRQQLQLRNMKQAEFARELGVYPSSVGQWLGGASPTLEHLERILDYFGCDFNNAFREGSAAQAEGTYQRSVGHISNGEVTMLNSDQWEISPIAALLEDTELWRTTKGDVVTLTVTEGDQPFPKGSRVLFRQLRAGAKLRAGLFVVVEVMGKKVLATTVGARGRKIISGYLVGTEVIPQAGTKLELVAIGVVQALDFQVEV